MKHIRSGCQTAFKYLVQYFKFSHFALNQIQLYYLFPKRPVKPLWNELALPFQFSDSKPKTIPSPSSNSFGHWSLKLHLLKTKLTHAELPFVLWKSHIILTHSSRWLLTMIIPLKNLTRVLSPSSRGIGEENSIILLAVSFVCYLGITQMLSCRLIHLKLLHIFSLKP